MEKIDELKALIDQVGLTHYGKSLRTKNIHLLEWIMDETISEPEQTSLGERVFIVLNGSDQTICQYGSRKIFNTLNKGYRFCAAACRCRREEQSRKITNHLQNLPTGEQDRRTQAQQDTMVERYGVTNPMHLEDVKQRLVDTNLERHGVMYPGQSVEVKEKIAATNLERYGGHPASTEEVKAKIRQTNLERHGTENTMQTARQAYFEQTGIINPFMLPEMQDKARQTMFDRYGVRHALQDEGIFFSMQEKNKAKFGVQNVMQNPEVVEQFRKNIAEKYGRRWANQDHFSDETFLILEDQTAFTDLFLTLSLREVAIGLNIGYDTARKYCVRYGIELPKSSYEVAIAAFLRNHGIKVRLNDKTFIYPFEVDLMIDSHKLGIEFGGLYYHNEDHKPDERYHLNKLKAVNAKGYRLITIFEDEWIINRHICESRILNVLGRSERGKGARKLLIREATAEEASIFLNRYHLQGSAEHGYSRYAACDGDQIVAIMTFCKHRDALGRRKDENKPDELLRFATDGKNYPGVASRLFSAFIEEHKPERLMSFADRRWSDGHMYMALGFTLTDDDPKPGYWYVHPSKVAREHRYRYQKHKIMHLVEGGENKTEREIMKELRYTRIYDCGMLNFIWQASQAPSDEGS